MSFTRRHLILAAVALAVVGCRKNTDRVPEHDSSGLAVADTVGLPTGMTPPRDSLAGTLAERTEPQHFFDQARAAFATEDRVGAASALRQGAAYFHAIPDTASAAVRVTLDDVERSLSALADRLDGASAVTVRELERAFVSANLAEAERHHALSTIVWARRDTLRTGEELVMAVDHLERAAKDARIALGAKATRELAAARKTGTALLARRPLGDAASVPRTQEGIGDAIRDVRARSTR